MELEAVFCFCMKPQKKTTNTHLTAGVFLSTSSCSPNWHNMSVWFIDFTRSHSTSSVSNHTYKLIRPPALLLSVSSVSLEANGAKEAAALSFRSPVCFPPMPHGSLMMSRADVGYVAGRRLLAGRGVRTAGGSFGFYHPADLLSFESKCWTREPWDAALPPVVCKR